MEFVVGRSALMGFKFRFWIDLQAVRLREDVQDLLNELIVRAGGLDLDKTLDAVKGGAAGSWMLSNRGPQMLERDWRPGFTIDLQQKDLRLVLEAADELGIPALGTSLVFNLYRTLQARGLGSEGNHALVKALEHISGIKVGVDT